MEKSSNQSALRAGIWYTITNYLSKGAIYLTTPIFTSLLTKVEIGKYNNINAWLQVLLPLLSFEFFSSLTLARFDYKDEYDEYISSSVLYGSLIAGFFGVILLSFQGFFTSLFDVDGRSLVLMVLYMITYPAIQFYQKICMLRYNYKGIIWLTILSLLLPLAVSLLFVYTWDDRLWGRIVGNYVTNIVLGLIILLILVYKGKKLSFKYFSYAVKLSFPLMWHVLAMHMLATGDRIVITKVLGDEANAMYTIAYTVCGLISILSVSMNNAFSPWCSEKMHDKDNASVRKMSKPYVLLYSAILLLTLFIAPELLLFMGGKDRCG